MVRLQQRVSLLVRAFRMPPIYFSLSHHHNLGQWLKSLSLSSLTNTLGQIEKCLICLVSIRGSFNQRWKCRDVERSWVNPAKQADGHYLAKNSVTKANKSYL